jgi:hypothetical protein
MRPFMFLCPNTGYIVQAQADDAVPGEKPHTFHLISCASCGRSHLVDPVTGELACEESRAQAVRRAGASCRAPPQN